MAKGGIAMFESLARKIATFALRFVPADKPYGTSLFDALNRLSPHFALEGVVLRENPDSGAVEVYLTRRSETDTAYPGEYHCPGSAIRNIEDWHNVADRLGRGEFGCPIKQLTLLYHAAFFYQEARGWYMSLPVVLELDGEPREGKWYPINDLSSPTVSHHRQHIIPAAVAYWRNRALYDAGSKICAAVLNGSPLDDDESRRIAALLLSAATS